MRSMLLPLLLISVNLWAGEYAATGSAVPLTPPEEFYMAPQWSPQGEQLAASGRSYNQLYLIEFPTGYATQLSADFSAGYGFAWSHDGSRIATRISNYENMRRTHSLVSIDVSSHTMEIHIPQTNRLAGRPRWTNDDTALFLSYAENTQLVSVNGERTAPTSHWVSVENGQLVHYRSLDDHSVLFDDQDRVTSYALSPDGQDIVYSTSGQNLWIAPISGSSRISLGKGIAPSWSPDSEWFTFMLTEDDGHEMLNSEIFLMPKDGSGRINITNTPDRFEMHPQWSPDGSWIVYDTEGEGQLFLQQIEWR